MFNNYEELECNTCRKSFTGRRSIDDNLVLCIDCCSKDSLSIVNEGDRIPISVNEEIESGKGGIKK